MKLKKGRFGGFFGRFYIKKKTDCFTTVFLKTVFSVNGFFGYDFFGYGAVGVVGFFNFSVLLLTPTDLFIETSFLSLEIKFRVISRRA